MKRQRSNLRTWLSLSVITFLGLLAIYLGLPALLLLLQVPSFALGNENLWVLRWQNDAARSGVEFNLLPPLIVAIAVGFIGYLMKSKKRF